jgi:phosphoribosyl 1,2-cyclic phosphodiesterase
MLVRFWGTRGSLPTPLGHRAVRAKIRAALQAADGRRFDGEAALDAFIDGELPFSVRATHGGNTSCVELVAGGDDYVLCDLGSGLREFGHALMARHGPARKHRFHVFMSHLHWDHIMGFPFFTPAYIPGNDIRIYGCHKAIREALRQQQSAPCFPVDFRALGASIEFVELEPDRDYEINGLQVRAILQNHAGDSYGYRFGKDGKSVVYSTDSEHKFSQLDETYPFVGFFRDADLLIFDAMYALAEAISIKEDWGHSSNIVGVELAQLARVKHLVMFHHEPVYSDETLETVLAETRRYEEISRPGDKLTVSTAYDGLEIEI